MDFDVSDVHADLEAGRLCGEDGRWRRAPAGRSVDDAPVGDRLRLL